MRALKVHAPVGKTNMVAVSLKLHVQEQKNHSEITVTRNREDENGGRKLKEFHTFHKLIFVQIH